MTTTDLSAYIEAGKALDPDARAIVAHELQRVDEADQGEIDAAWGDEIDCRVDEVVNGAIAPVSGEETLRMARARLAARRA